MPATARDAYPGAMTERDLAARRAWEAEQVAKRRAESDRIRDADRDLRAIRRQADEQREAERDALLAPWRHERGRLGYLLLRAQEQLTSAEARADHDPLSIAKQLELLGAQQAVEQCEAKVNAHAERKPD